MVDEHTDIPSQGAARETKQQSFWFVEKDGGFTSTGVVIALALTLALLFTSAQVYWINSKAGDIQFAADAGALAAENVVGEYYVIARIADAVIVSLSLFGIVVFGIAIVVSCIPYMQSVGAELMNFGERVFKVRDRCAEQSKEMLIKLQRALPFLSAVNASTVISSNDFSPDGEVHYQGLAILVPLTGDDVEFASDDEAQESADTLREQNEETSELTDQSEDARREMEQAKLDGYRADCGADPNYCMYERAGKLAGLSGAANPYFSSVDLWCFDYAFKRAKAYYQKRLALEAPSNSTLEEQVRSNVRKQFFSYAVDEMGKGYAKTDANGVLDAYFPLLARNQSEIRGTRLYTDQVYPVDGSGKIHGTTSCPGVEDGVIGSGSIAQLEGGSYSICETCGLSINSVGRVASASTSIENGFEYHYRLVADAAKRYEAASKEYEEYSREAKDRAEDAFDTFDQALAALETPRFNPQPPGRHGCIVIVFDPSSHTMPAPFSSSFVSGGSSLPPRIAISAAALAEDAAGEGNSILTTFLDRAEAQAGSGTAWASGLGVFDSILEVWGAALLAYSQGADSLAQGVGDFLRSIPVVNATPLASWAQDTLQETIEACGLQGVDLSAPKPVIVNSIHVIRAGDSEALAVLGQAKVAYSSLPGSGNGTAGDGLLDGVLIEIEQQGTVFLENEFTVFTISFGDLPGTPQIPIKIQLPAAAIEQGRGLLSDGLDQARSLLGGGGSGNYWE
jgi:hypothetical protein